METSSTSVSAVTGGLGSRLGLDHPAGRRSLQDGAVEDLGGEGLGHRCRLPSVAGRTLAGSGVLTLGARHPIARPPRAGRPTCRVGEDPALRTPPGEKTPGDRAPAAGPARCSSLRCWPGAAGRRQRRHRAGDPPARASGPVARRSRPRRGAPLCDRPGRRRRAVRGGGRRVVRSRADAVPRRPRRARRGHGRGVRVHLECPRAPRRLAGARTARTLRRLVDRFGGGPARGDLCVTALDAELVALGVGEDHPSGSVRPPVVADQLRAESEEPRRPLRHGCGRPGRCRGGAGS